MAEKIFVIYASLAGTASARPVLEFYNEDEAHVPALAALGYTPAETGWIAVDPFTVTDTADEATGRALTVNQTTGAIAGGTFDRGDVATAQLALSVQIAELIAEWNWTQELDAQITRATQESFAAWIIQLEAVPANPLWATNPAGIVLPAVPAVVASTLTVAQQVATATFLDDAAIPAQKLALANWNTLQTVWGFDWADFTPFNVVNIGNPSLGLPPGPDPVLSWVWGRTGDRALRMTMTGAAGMQGRLWTRSNYGFAAAPGDAFLVEAWVQASSVNTQVYLELAGWDVRLAPVNVLNFGAADTTVNAAPGTGFTKLTGLIICEAGTGCRWAGARLRMVKGTAGTDWITVDGLTITRMPQIPNAYSQNGANDTITSTATDFAGAQTLLIVALPRGGNATNTILTAAARIGHGNQATDALRLQFWITQTPFGGVETALTTWLEYGPVGAWQHRATSMTVTDPTIDTKLATYQLKVSKLASVGTITVSNKHMNALVVPKV